MPIVTCPDCGRDVSTLAAACPHCGRPSPAGMAPMPLAATPAAEETLWRGSPSAMLLAGHIGLIIVVAVGIPLFTRFFGTSMPDFERGQSMIRAGWILTGILVAIQLVALLVAWLKLRSTVYIVTNQRVIIEQGIFAKTVDEIDLRYVDDSQFTQSVMDRILGIGSVRLVSTDKSTPQYTLRSIASPRNVRELIRTHAYQVSQRQIFTRAT